MNILEAKFTKGFMRMIHDGWEQNWHERNGGNLSFRIPTEDVENIKDQFTTDRPWTPIGTEVPGLAGEYFMVTGSGKFFRNVVLEPEANIGIVEIDETGENYRIVWGLLKGSRPTSELPAHLMNHQVTKARSNGAHRVIYHAHPANVVALTFILPLEDEVFTREIWEMATECPVVFPQGIGVLPWMVCGGKEIAVATSELMKKYDVAIWAHHGMFCSGENFDLTFGLFHTVEKAAEILVKVRSMADEKRQTIQADEFRALAEEFGLNINQEVLK